MTAGREDATMKRYRVKLQCGSDTHVYYERARNAARAAELVIHRAETCGGLDVNRAEAVEL